MDFFPKASYSYTDIRLVQLNVQPLRVENLYLTRCGSRRQPELGPVSKEKKESINWFVLYSLFVLFWVTQFPFQVLFVKYIYWFDLLVFEMFVKYLHVCIYLNYK